jgi:hypothetical protein
MLHPHPRHQDDELDRRQNDDADEDADEDDDLNEESWPVYAEPPQTHDGMPIRGWHRGEPIPDLDRIPQARWREVLAPLRRGTRQVAMSGTQRDFTAAAILVGELLADDPPIDATPPDMPAGVPPRRGAGRQVNFRLGAEEHDRLATAARLFAMRPSTLARVLTMRGVDRALYEERRDR